MIDKRPDIAHAFMELSNHLMAFDTMMSNGGRDVDGYTLQVAHLSGVRDRVVNLGTIACGYVSPLFDAGAAFDGLCHCVAHSSQASLSRSILLPGWRHELRSP